LEQPVSGFKVLAFEDFELRAQRGSNLGTQTMVVVNNGNFGLRYNRGDGGLRRELTRTGMPAWGRF
jgi:hypothetical protein